jgi:hypothetical protein
LRHSGVFTRTLVGGIASLVYVASSSEAFQGFVAKYDPAGSLIWANEIGAAGLDWVFASALDAEGNLYIAGKFEQTVTFDSIELTSAGGADIFVAKLDSAGNHQWAVRAGFAANDNANGLGVDTDGFVYVAGAINDSASKPTRCGATACSIEVAGRARGGVTEAARGRGGLRRLGARIPAHGLASVWVMVGR